MNIFNLKLIKETNSINIEKPSHCPFRIREHDTAKYINFSCVLIEKICAKFKPNEEKNEFNKECPLLKGVLLKAIIR